MTTIFDRRQFINWIEVPDPPKPKPRKLPFNPMLGPDARAIDPHDPKNWMTYQEAVGVGLPVGFVLAEQDPFFFLDLDNCLTEAGWKPEAITLFNQFPGAAAEVSVSGTGMHIMGMCDQARLADRKHKWGGWLEFYTSKRFVALGKGFNDGHFNIDWTDVLLRIVPKSEPKDLAVQGNGPVPEWTGTADDDELISKMISARGSIGAQFGVKASAHSLWTGDAAALSQVFPSMSKDAFDRSSADAALMSHLAFWTGKDARRMDRIFRRSALMRPKYESRPEYRASTIGGAISNCKRVYDVVRQTPAGQAVPPGQPGAPGADAGEVMTVGEQINHFVGCVYVRDIHRIMIPGGTLLKSEQFNATYGGKIFIMSADGSAPTKKAWEAFTENRVYKFPKANTTCFRPKATPGALIDGAVNCYFPEPIPRLAGDPTPFLDLVARLLPVQRDRDILLAWCASLIQNPGAKFQWSIVLQGAEGNGKSSIGTCLEYAIGKRYTHSPAAEDLANAFNSYLENKLLITVEEIYLQGRRELLDLLKPLITKDWIEVQAKGVDKRMIDNFANWFFCTNHKDAILTTKDDRRYAIFLTAQQVFEDIERDGLGGDYFPRYWTWLRSGGFAIVAHFLDTYKIPAELDPAGNCHRAPNTSTKMQAVSASMGKAEQELREAIESGDQGFRNGWVSMGALETLFKEKFIRISRTKQTEMLEKMGYKSIGRAKAIIVDELGKRPILYVNRTLWNEYLTVKDYCLAQGYQSVRDAPSIVPMPGQARLGT